MKYNWKKFIIAAVVLVGVHFSFAYVGANLAIAEDESTCEPCHEGEDECNVDKPSE